MLAQPNNLGETATRIAAEIIADEFRKASRVATRDERDTFEAMRPHFAEQLAPEVEDQFLEDGAGVPKLREFARRKMTGAVLRTLTPTYSVKSGMDSIEFFRTQLLEKFVRYELPPVDVSEISPNLAFVIKSSKKFASLSTMIKAARTPAPYLG